MLPKLISLPHIIFIPLTFVRNEKQGRKKLIESSPAIIKKPLILTIKKTIKMTIVKILEKTKAEIKTYSFGFF